MIQGDSLLQHVRVTSFAQIDIALITLNMCKKPPMFEEMRKHTNTISFLRACQLLVPGWSEILMLLG